MLRAVRFCLMIEGQEGVTWGDWLALAQTAERLGFEALFRSDHCISGQGRLRLGTLVSQITFRSPSVLARSAATVDQISGGRVEIGMGAGWWGEEHTQFGFPFPSTVDRFAMLEEQLEIVDGLLAQQPFSFHGEHYALDRAELLPSTVQRPRPPIILGAGASDHGGSGWWGAGQMSSTRSEARLTRFVSASNAPGPASRPSDANSGRS